MPEKDFKTIRAKRRATTQKAITAKVQRGEATGDERAVMRIGASNTRILTGQDDLSDWSDEELRYGRRAGKGECFTGRPPKIVPKAIHDELVRRTLVHANDLMRDNLEDAVTMLCKLAKSPGVEAKDRLRAISMILDRVMGKSPERVEISGQSPWLIALQAGVVNVSSNGASETDDDVTDADWEDT